MRRLLPWALVVLVGLGAGPGATIGAVGSPARQVPSAAQWVANVLATTEAAGTAHLDYAEVTASRRSDDEGGKLPASELEASPGPAQRPPGSITTINTLHLSRFGQPVHVTALAAIESGPGSSVIFRLRCRS